MNRDEREPDRDTCDGVACCFWDLHACLEMGVVASFRGSSRDSRLIGAGIKSPEAAARSATRLPRSLSHALSNCRTQHNGEAPPACPLALPHQSPLHSAPSQRPTHRRIYSRPRSRLRARTESHDICEPTRPLHTANSLASSPNLRAIVLCRLCISHTRTFISTLPYDSRCDSGTEQPTASSTF